MWDRRSLRQTEPLVKTKKVPICIGGLARSSSSSSSESKKPGDQNFSAV